MNNWNVFQALFCFPENPYNVLLYVAFKSMLQMSQHIKNQQFLVSYHLSTLPLYCKMTNKS